jgi:aminoglycoside phosphotransferase (APT) family kinase protein
MRDVRAALAALPARVLALPEALWYDPARRCLVQPRVPGVPFADLAGTAAFEHALARAGEGLAELHDTDALGGEPRHLPDHLRELIRPHPSDLGEAVPEFRVAVRRLLAGFARAEAGIGAVAPATIHRDFHLRQLFLDESRVWLIDWDLCARGDPALDVGNFLMYLEVRMGERSEQPAAAFLQGYFRRAPESRRPRIALYKGLNYLRRACKTVRLGGPTWREQAGMLLGRAEHCMAGYEGS